MDLLSRIASWLGENEATISAVVGIAVLTGIVFAGVRSLLRRRAETSQAQAPGASAETPATTDSAPADLDPLTVPGFEGRPAIAVLPFDNLSGDPEQEYFADGIAEDLITRLSAWRRFPVIARNSSFTYKGKPVDVKQVSRELGVRYVVEGSVRRSKGRVRITTQLIDATTGAHVWAETYDRELDDIFAVQDEISEAVVASMYPELLRFDVDRVMRQEPESVTVWECVQRASWHWNRMTKEDNAKAERFLKQATEMDPSSARAFGGLAFVHFQNLMFRWTDQPAESSAELEHAARKAVALDDKDPLSHIAFAAAANIAGQQEETIAASELATRLNPSLATAHAALGMFLALAGRPEEALSALEKAMRLSPRDPETYSFLRGMALAHLAAGRFEEAIKWGRQSTQRRPDFPYSHLILTVAYAHLDRMDEARSALGNLQNIAPDFSITNFRRISAAVDPSLAELVFDGLRKAGLKE